MDQIVSAPGFSLSPRYVPDSDWARCARAVVSLQLNFFGRHVKWAGSRALHFQCDYGLMADGMVRRGATVTAVDANPDLLAAARARSFAGGFRVDYRQARPDRPLPFEAGSFDIVLCDHVFDRDQLVPALLSELRRVLRPHGTVLFTCVNATMRARLARNLAPDLYLPGLPPSLRSLRPRRPGRLRRDLIEAGFEPHRFAGLGARAVTLGLRPRHRVTQVMPVLFMGTADRL